MTARVSFDRVADVYDRTQAMPPDATAAVAAGIAAVLRDVAGGRRVRRRDRRGGSDERITPQLDALLGGLDTAVETPASFSLTIARLPA